MKKLLPLFTFCFSVLCSNLFCENNFWLIQKIKAENEKMPLLEENFKSLSQKLKDTPESYLSFKSSDRNQITCVSMLSSDIEEKHGSEIANQYFPDVKQFVNNHSKEISSYSASLAQFVSELSYQPLNSTSSMNASVVEEICVYNDQVSAFEAKLKEFAHKLKAEKASITWGVYKLVDLDLNSKYMIVYSGSAIEPLKQLLGSGVFDPQLNENLSHSFISYSSYVNYFSKDLSSLKMDD